MSDQSHKRPYESRLFYFSACLIISSLFLMGQVSRAIQKTDDEQFWEFTSMFAEIYKEISDRYVEPVDSKKLFEGALQGMFLSLDPHSQYMDPDSYSQLEKDTEGSFSGIGIHITLKNGVLTVISPIPGSPSAKKGIRPWDRIIEIDGKKTEGITLPEAVKKLTGPTGTDVKVAIWREGETAPLNFTLTRNDVKIESIYYEMIKDTDMGYARITRFSDNTSRDLRKAIDEFTAANAKGIIIDLRYNTGGLLDEAIKVSNLFLPRNKLIVSTKGRISNLNAEHLAKEDQASDLPLAVLINKASASASEIFAGAIKDHNRGIIVGIKGQRSFGKGSVQTIEELAHSFTKDENGNYEPAAIRLTTAKYYTPSGVSIDKVGVTPDIAVEMPKGLELEVTMNGLLGDPDTNEDEPETSNTGFAWGTKPEDAASTATKDGEASSFMGTEEGSAVQSATLSDDETTTGVQPKRIIPIDRALFPESEIEGEAKKPEPKKGEKKDFLDYQLHVAKKLMQEWIATGKKPIEPVNEAESPSKNVVSLPLDDMDGSAQ